MKPLLLAAALLTVTAGSAVATPAATPILPGFWKYNLRAVGVIPLDDGRRCISPSEVSEFLAFPGNKHYKCSYSSNTVSNGRVEMAGACVDKKGRRAPIRATGVYSPQNFRLNIALTTTNGVPLRGTMTATRISASCPAGAPGTPGNP